MIRTEIGDSVYTSDHVACNSQDNAQGDPLCEMCLDGGWSPSDCAEAVTLRARFGIGGEVYELVPLCADCAENGWGPQELATCSFEDSREDD